MARIWVGTDIGKSHHRCVVLDVEGKWLLSQTWLRNGKARGADALLPRAPSKQPTGSTPPCPGGRSPPR